jgi:hypothetical protein
MLQPPGTRIDVAQAAPCDPYRSYAGLYQPRTVGDRLLVAVC